MPEDKEFQQRMQRIETLIHQLEAMPDRSLWTSVRELMESVMALHGMALDRLLTIVAEQEGPSRHLTEALSRDELVASVLLLHDVHPVDLATRAQQALDKAEKILRGYGARAELLDARDGNIRIQIRGVTGAHIAKSARSTIEDAMCQAAPDAAAVTIVGLEQFSPGFVPIAQLQMSAASGNGHLATPVAKGGV